MKVVHNNNKSDKKRSKKQDNCKDKNTAIEKLIVSFCKIYLNKSCEDLCIKIKKDYLKKIPNAYCRGEENIWAASFIWAMAKANFIVDSFEYPEFGFDTVCEFFGTKKSTVGNKAGKIRKTLNIDYFNVEYLLDDSPIDKLLSSFTMTPEGFIVQDDKNQEDDEDEFLLDDVEMNEVKIYSFDAVYSYKLKNSDYLQVDYLLKKKSKEFINRDGIDREIHFDKIDERTIRIFGTCSLIDMHELIEFIEDYDFKIL